MTLAGEKSISRERRAGHPVVAPAAVAGIVWTTPPLWAGRGQYTAAATRRTLSVAMSE